MARKKGQRPLSAARLQSPEQEFASYCEAEFERRRSSDEPFDETAYREAMAMTLEKLQAIAGKERV
jgi:hypothetical protein